jgi:hypothetical protein
MQSDPFEGPKLKVERAKRHIADYRIAFKAFADANVMEAATEMDNETGETLIIFPPVPPAPSELRLCAADALYNLRSALDQAVCRCAKLACDSPEGTYFPHGKDKTGFEVSLKRKCEKVPQSVRDSLAALEPYYGGNGSLFRVLHDLNLVDKHTDLLTISHYVRNITGTVVQRPDSALGHDGENVNEATSPDASIHQDIKVTMVVAFSDVEAVKGQSVTQVLVQLADLVGETVGIIELAMSTYLHGRPRSERTDP